MKFSPNSDISNKNLRSELIKTVLLIGVFIFSLIILKKIFNENSSALVTENGPISNKSVPFISNEELELNYITDSLIEELLLANPPFIIKLRALERINYSFKKIPQIMLQALFIQIMTKISNHFVEQSELFFSTTKGLTLYINGVNIQNISDYEHPLRLTIKPSPPSMIIKRYKPIN